MMEKTELNWFSGVFPRKKRVQFDTPRALWTRELREDYKREQAFRRNLKRLKGYGPERRVVLRWKRHSLELTALTQTQADNKQRQLLKHRATRKRKRK